MLFTESKQEFLQKIKLPLNQFFRPDEKIGKNVFLQTHKKDPYAQIKAMEELTLNN